MLSATTLYNSLGNRSPRIWFWQEQTQIYRDGAINAEMNAVGVISVCYLLSAVLSPV
jgi:hypothetical protein